MAEKLAHQQDWFQVVWYSTRFAVTFTVGVLGSVCLHQTPFIYQQGQRYGLKLSLKILFVQNICIVNVLKDAIADSVLFASFFKQRLNVHLVHKACFRQGHCQIPSDHVAKMLYFFGKHHILHD